MTGDIILWIKKMWKQNITCIHDYKADRIGIITGLFFGRVCQKCNKYE